MSDILKTWMKEGAVKLSYDELVGRFDEAVPADFLKESLRCVYASYREAHEFCQANFSREEAHDLRPFYRRAILERNWRAVADKFTNVTARSVANDAGSSYHTVVEAGCIVLTTSAVGSPGEMVRDAEFRKTYAESSQLSLFNRDEELILVNPSVKLYAILLHGSQINPRFPDFVTIAFPDKKCTQYVASMSLTGRYREIVQTLTEIPVEPVEAEINVKLKERTARAGDKF